MSNEELYQFRQYLQYPPDKKELPHAQEILAAIQVELGYRQAEQVWWAADSFQKVTQHQLRDRLSRLTIKQLDHYLDVFLEANVQVPRVLYEIRAGKQERESSELLVKLLEEQK